MSKKADKKKKREIVAQLRGLARELVPMSQLCGKVVPSKRRVLRERVAKKESKGGFDIWVGL